MKFRAIKISLYRWKYLVLGVIAIYCFCILPDGITYSIFKLNRDISSDDTQILRPHLFKNDLEYETNDRRVDGASENKDIGGNLAKLYKMKNNKESFHLISKRYGNLYIEDIVGEPEGALKTKMSFPKINPKAPPKIILSWDAGHSYENLGGCFDWNCEFSTNKSDLKRAGAIIVKSENSIVSDARKPDQYVVYFSQESPIHSIGGESITDYFNLSLNFRRETAASSPYGYTVKLSSQSLPEEGKAYDKKLIEGKNRTIAWFVSHCNTASQREIYVNHLKKYINVDIYGKCGEFACERGGNCENMLDTDYHFYIAFENSICKNYLTEKLWSQGFQRTIIPLVLKREYVEPYAPPNSFIAVDDFGSVEKFAQYLHYLIKNKTAYMEYFQWRRKYKVIFLDGSEHDEMERPWGFCQICRLLWQEPREKHVINDFRTFWSKSCEDGISFVNRFI